MKHYLVKGKVEIPYPYEFEEKVEASNPATAIGRIYRKLRKDRLKKRKITHWRFEVITL